MEPTVLAETGFTELSEEELSNVEGGLFPIVLFGGAVVISQTTAIIAGAITGTAVLAAGIYSGFMEQMAALKKKYKLGIE
jgi:bacteriocin-like protein